MSNSSLVDYVKISPNKNPRNHKIDTITIHCVVGQLSVETLGDIFSKKSKQASCNYGIGADGRIGMYVEESYRSWCSSNAKNDHRALTYISAKFEQRRIHLIVNSIRMHTITSTFYSNRTMIVFSVRRTPRTI